MRALTPRVAHLDFQRTQHAPRSSTHPTARTVSSRIFLLQGAPPTRHHFGAHMTSQWTCPFCGKVGRRSKEHVWPQWLHDSPVAQELLRSAHGERISYGYSDLERTAGRLVAVPQ